MLRPVLSFLMKQMGMPVQAGPRVSVIRLNGRISPATSNPLQDRQLITFEKVKLWADVAFAVKGVQAVALSITCPGGAPTQTEMIHDYLRNKAKQYSIPIYAFANDVAASGGFWLMCAGDELYACKTSLVGSIGVVSPNFGFVEAMKKLGVERRLLKAGESKVSIDPFSEVSDEQRVQAEEIMKSLHSTFIDAVKERRKGKLQLDQADDLFSGRVWTGVDAQKIGLVDHLGDMESVIREKFGQDVNMIVFGSTKPAGWFPGFQSEAIKVNVGSVTDAVWEALQTRLLWSRYGL